MVDLRFLHGTHWVAEPGYLRRALEQVARIPTCPTAREIAAYRRERLEEARQAATRAVRASRGKVGVIPIQGPIEQRMSSALMKLGGTSTEEVSAALDVLLADASVGTIVFHVDSPGGSSYGVEELSDKIFAARQQKRIYAIANSLAASAGYWLATSAETMVVTPGGDVGSVGVYSIHFDESKFMEEEGIKVSIVHAGKYKVEGNPYQPLSAETAAYWQSDVDRIYTKFVSALKRNRNASTDAVRNNFGQGRIVDAEAALAAGMVDRVMSFEELMGRITGGDGDSVRKASADLLARKVKLLEMRG